MNPLGGNWCIAEERIIEPIVERFLEICNVDFAHRKKKKPPDKTSSKVTAERATRKGDSFLKIILVDQGGHAELIGTRSILV